jgi:hypothetical protein
MQKGVSMLPDQFLLKAEVRSRLNVLFRQMVNGYLGVVAEAPRSVIHEGRRTVIVRESGEVDETKLFQASAAFEIKASEVSAMSLQELHSRLDVAARGMAKQISQGFFQNVSEAVDKVGNAVDGKGRGFTPELILEVLERIWIEFDEHGRPQMPTMVIHPDQATQVQQAFKQLDNDPDLSDRFARLMDKKREEWRAREASRKLVG